MRKLIWSGLVVLSLAGCASTPEKAEEPAAEPYQPEFKPGESPKNTTSQEGKAPIQPIARNASPQPKDPVRLEGYRIQRGVMDVSVVHGGGCKEHTYSLEWDGEFQEGVDGTPVANMVLVHDGHEDHCKALVKATPRFDLASVAERFREKYGKPSGAVDIGLQDKGATLRYEF
jgi:hypothetical protein